MEPFDISKTSLEKDASKKSWDKDLIIKVVEAVKKKKETI
jgi:hypothetical protein